MTAPLLVTIATRRSGTKFLAACPNAGTDVRSFGEPFNPGPPDSPFPAFAIGWMGARTGTPSATPRRRRCSTPFSTASRQARRRRGGSRIVEVMYNNLGAFTGA